MSPYSKKPRAIGDLLKSYLNEHPEQIRVKRAMAMAVLPEVAGTKIMGHILETWLKQGTLFIRTDSQVWRQELHFQRTELREKLNKRVQLDVIDEIIVK
ncbi:MAG: DUF721 domain-containing protein [Balneolales bacterium]|nr:DUF721 domain-containing protein [Balneolales bacterium]